ncbi:MULTISPECIES: succinylglutamate desuccinylase/aspartoacylase family protein [unclassified Hyphomicrobium]|uniref:succinylglutamate desuccinylase/aspartoacylase family protein n=1 Tax=unclassified Hyphomicrobium TaxID=2619925 RepID=UPI000213E8AF|nr:MULTISPECIES: succinylglutamate desuccinylase/aspartoacylase family protein [unclassified Hyphomicrobium]CCB64725.1 Succinylglutamate desuccinylase/aspartoacylase [Hyphomicrobium sp. MC1]
MSPNKIDRRDFMTHSIALAGTSAIIASDAVAAASEETAKTVGSNSETVFTGESIQGKKVVSRLNVDDLEPGRKHFLYFQGVETPGGQHWYVSVVVAKGVRPGKRFTLTSGVHGDEMSSIQTVQTVIDRLDPAQMSGTVMAVLDIARPAVESMQRRWPNSGRGTDLIDMNREWPGDENGASATSRHAGLLFNRLLKPNSDLAIDFHTGTTGLEVAAFLIGDRHLPDVKTMADLYPVGLMWDDAAYPGVLHNAFVDVGIPCFTPEVGAARILDRDMIALFVEGTLNVLKHYGVVSGPIGRTAADAKMLIGNAAFPIIATHGGLVEFHAKLDEDVKAGQTIAVQRNMFGEVVAEYTTAVNGKLAAYRTDASSDPGNVLAFILFSQPGAPQHEGVHADTEKSYPE